MSWLRLEGSTRDPDLVRGPGRLLSDPLWAAGSPVAGRRVPRRGRREPDHRHGRGGVRAGDGVRAWRRGGCRRRAGALGRRPALGGARRAGGREDDVRLVARARLGAAPGAVRGAGSWNRAARGVARGVSARRSRKDDGLDPAGRAELELLARRSVDGRRIAPRHGRRARTVGRAVAARRRRRGWPADSPGGQRLVRSRSRDFVRYAAPSTPSWRSGPARVPVPPRRPAGRRPRSRSRHRSTAGGTLDWYHFDRVPNADPLGAAGDQSTRELTVLPAPAALPRDAGSRASGRSRTRRCRSATSSAARRTSCVPSSAASRPSTADGLDGRAVPPPRRQRRQGREAHGPRRLRRTPRHPGRRRARRAGRVHGASSSSTTSRGPVPRSPSHARWRRWCSRRRH